MSMPDHIILSNGSVTGFTRIFCQKGLSCSWETAKLDCFVLLEWENPHTYRKYLTHLESWQRGPGGRGNDTPWLQVPAARSFEELPCFRVKFSNIHPASESDFLSGIFFGGIYCYANFFCYANFSIVFKPIFLGEG